MTLKQFVKQVAKEKEYDGWKVSLWIFDGQLLATAYAVKDVEVMKRRFIFWKRKAFVQNAREITSVIK